MDRKFEFELPEVLKNIEGAKEALEPLLEQHKTFVAGGYKEYVAPDKLDEVIKQRNEANAQAQAKAEAETKAFNERIKAISKGILPEENISLAIKQVEIKQDDTDEIIKQKLNKAVEEFPVLKGTSTAGITKKIVIEEEVKKEKPKRRFFSKNDDLDN